MSDFIEYPKAIYSVAGKFAVVGSKLAEDEQRAEWGEAVLDDLPNPLAIKIDQDPVDSDGAQHQGVDATMDESTAPNPVEPMAEPQA